MVYLRQSGKALQRQLEIIADLYLNQRSKDE